MIFTQGHEKFTSVIFYMNMTYVSLSDYLKLTLKFYIVLLHDIINIVNQNVLSCKHVSIIFYPENMTSFLNYVKAMLRTLYAWHGSYDDTSVSKRQPHWRQASEF